MPVFPLCLKEEKEAFVFVRCCFSPWGLAGHSAAQRKAGGKGGSWHGMARIQGFELRAFWISPWGLGPWTRSPAECVASATMAQAMSQNKTNRLGFFFFWTTTDFSSHNARPFFSIASSPLAPKLFALKSAMIILIFLDILHVIVTSGNGNNCGEMLY